MTAAIVIVSLLVAAGCGEGVPEEEPHLVGEITSMGRAVGSRAVQILVEERPGVHDGSDKAYVFVLDDGAVFERAHHGYRGSRIGHLDVGVSVQVWFDGPVQESYPLQGTARAVVIIPGQEPAR